MGELATTTQETPFYYPAGGEDLFGILTTPTTEPNGLVAILLSGGVWTPSPGRNRIWVRMARLLAAYGWHAIRLDYRGVGESSGSIETYRLDEPFVDDVTGVVEWAGQHQLGDLVLMGTCFGARTAMASASRVRNLRGVALFPAPVRDFEMGQRLASLPLTQYLKKAASAEGLAKLRDPANRTDYRRLIGKKARRWLAGGRKPESSDERRFQWVSPVFVEQLAGILGRGVPVLLVFGEEDAFYEDFKRGRSGRLGEVLDGAGSLVSVKLVAGKTHGLTTSAVQDRVIEAIGAWLPSVFGDGRPPETSWMGPGLDV